jgi:N-acetylglutamate synthase-like GNAT family acetyltransferase
MIVTSNGVAMQILINPAKSADVADILKILETANMHNVPSPEMPELDWSCYFVARADGRIIGSAGYKILSPTSAKTTLMAVLPEYRRFGVGRALQERRMLALAERGIIELTTNADVPESIEWYKKHFGYREVGKLKKLHEFGRPDIAEWTTLKTDLKTWMKAYGQRSGG